MEGKFSTSRALKGLTSLLIVAALSALFFHFGRRVPLAVPRLVPSLRALPYYAWCSFLRMLAAYLLSLAFGLFYGLAAAGSPLREKVMLAVIDVAQSVPVIGFFPAAVYLFVSLGGHTGLGLEMAAVFLIFTSQAWNLALGVFESVKTVPADAMEALTAFGASRWLIFRRLLLPASIPRLVYNSILSWVSGWYFLIACEIITLGPTRYRLPGLGSFLMDSAEAGDGIRIAAGLLTLLAIIVAMDLLVWQPLSAYALKFRYDFETSPPRSASFAMATVLAPVGTGLLRAATLLFRPIGFAWHSLALPRWRPPARLVRLLRLLRTITVASFLGLLTLALGYSLWLLFKELAQPWPRQARLIPAATLASLLRILAAYLISLAWTLPCALLSGESERFNRWLTPLAEILASIPATALFPLILIAVIRLTGDMNPACILLLLTGMQWYLLFNLMAGVKQVPGDLREAARAFGMSRFQTWRKLVIPAVMPSLITGSLTAWGGGWNALIVSEYFVYNGQRHQVLGLGALLDAATYESGNGPMVLLALMSMILVVMGVNRLVWRPLYNFCADRYRISY